jgi:hypothetical protein
MVRDHAERLDQVSADNWAVIPPRSGATHFLQMSRPSASRRARCFDNAAIPADLYDDVLAPDCRPGRPGKHDLTGWRVVDDWPQRMPVTEGEVDVFEAWFGDILDELFGPP